MWKVNINSEYNTPGSVMNPVYKHFPYYFFAATLQGRCSYLHFKRGNWVSDMLSLRCQQQLLYKMKENLFISRCGAVYLSNTCFLIVYIHLKNCHYQFSSVAQSYPTLCDPMNRSMPGLPVHHQLPEFTQIHIHRVSDANQPSHPLSSPSPPAPNPSQHQGLFQWVNSLHEVAKVLEFQL